MQRYFRPPFHEVGTAGISPILSDLEYTYPYHQSIGFYLDRILDAQITRANSFVALDASAFPCFYLTCGMRDAARDTKWRVYLSQRAEMSSWRRASLAISATHNRIDQPINSERRHCFTTPDKV